MADDKTPAAIAEEARVKEMSELKTQIENLNKGIATYRDESKASKEESKKALETATAALGKLEEFAKLSNKKESGVKLSDEEEKKFKAFAEQSGLVSKDDLAKEKNTDFIARLKEVENQAVGDFLEQHPEYDDDDKWKGVMEQFVLYKQPTTLTAYRALLNRIFKDLNPDETKEARGKARAEIINREKLRLGGGSGGAKDDDVEKEIDELHKKYPRLSRETIVERLAETRSLLKAKK